jgi:hypothetical protein
VLGTRGPQSGGVVGGRDRRERGLDGGLDRGFGDGLGHEDQAYRRGIR